MIKFKAYKRREARAPSIKKGRGTKKFGLLLFLIQKPLML
jgi:hypothetical protein